MTSISFINVIYRLLNINIFNKKFNILFKSVLVNNLKFSKKKNFFIKLGDTVKLVFSSFFIKYTNYCSNININNLFFKKLKKTSVFKIK